MATLQFFGEFNITLDVYDNLTVYGNINDLTLKILGYYNATVKVSLV